MRPIFTDASSAILLRKARLFERLANELPLVIARSVYKEITQPGYPGAAYFAEAAREKIYTVQACPEKTALSGDLAQSGLDTGEKETICLYLAKQEGFILTDDGQAARFCDKHKLPFINALLVPRLFMFAGITDEKTCREQMKTLCEFGRYSDRVITLANKFTQQELFFFCSKMKSHSGLNNGTFSIDPHHPQQSNPK